MNGAAAAGGAAESAAPPFLDHNATTPVAPEVADRMWPFLTEAFGNPSSPTPQGRRAARAVAEAREQLAALIGAHPDEIVFTGGGTEASNLAVRGAAAGAEHRRAVTSAVEHPATAAPLAHLREVHGWRVDELGVDAEARIDPAEVSAGPLALGTLILAHNEVGTVQPMAAFAEAVRARGGLVHADGAQAVGKIPVDVDALGVDLLSVAAHKLYGPKGVGALYVRRGTRLAPVLRGAGQEGGLRPGTENVAGIVGLGAAAALAGAVMEAESVRQEALRELLWTELRSRIPDLVRISPRAAALPNTLMAAVPGTLGASVLEAAPGVAASTGSACHAGVHAPSAALIAMGFEPALALGALRLSLGRSTTEAGVRGAADSLARAAAASRPAG
ncbi:cysteine desulfurase family protein [Brevibacterium album]|uniref:cysteine desulfurase family protein n=1 Tax=Brevibacterium album TaxID=417948 RepID=UPI0004177716|nr:cysteine desulfurase family protein [Brevibacterium album]